MPKPSDPTRLALREGRVFKKMWHDLLLIRLFEERLAELYADQQMRCPVHLSIGQEAVAVGVSAALLKSDVVMSGHRAHAHYLARGGDMAKLVAEIYGKATGCCLGRGGSMHLIDMGVNFLGSTPIVAGTIPVAVGAAWAAQLQGQKSITVIFTGEGATEEGVWHESINFASLHHLPIIFVCENNLYSVYTPLPERQPDRPRADIAAANGLATASGNGNNIFEVYAMASKACEYVRSGRGPYFLEFATYRWREHCGPNFDNNIGYRTEAEFLRWQKKDPVTYMRRRMIQMGLVSEAEVKALEKRLKTKLCHVFIQAQKEPVAKEAHSVSTVYAD